MVENKEKLYDRITALEEEIESLSIELEDLDCECNELGLQNNELQHKLDMYIPAGDFITRLKDHLQKYGLLNKELENEIDYFDKFVK